MAELIKHECGLAMIRLRKSPAWFLEHRGDALWGLRKLYILMEKQHNRGQDGAGLASVKIDVPPGYPYIDSQRMTEPSPPWQSLIQEAETRLRRLADKHPGVQQDPDLLKRHFPWSGELLMAHLRYGTFGMNSLQNCHPVLRHNNWRARTLAMAGNFNLTNVDQQFDKLIELGQHPRDRSDTVTVLERVGHFLDAANQKIYDHYRAEGCTKAEISEYIAAELDLFEVLRQSAKHWDGGYAMGGLVGHGEMFLARDPNGIRPAYMYECEDFVAFASERPALATTFHLKIDEIQEVPPGHAAVVRRDGELRVAEFKTPGERKSCSFERIYFSRGSDADIYRERKALGRLLAPRALDAVNRDLENTVFTYVPNTARVSFMGLVEALNEGANKDRAKRLAEASGPLTTEQIEAEMRQRVRAEHIVIKDATLRTFITDSRHRKSMIEHIYDITYGVVRPGQDTLVCIDDSIVRGATLRDSLLRILSRLRPRRIIIASSAPQIRYPDCYGIDMSQLEHFAAFRAAIDLLRSSGRANLIDETYQEILLRRDEDRLEEANLVKAIYAPFEQEEISARIAQMLSPEDIDCDVDVLYQTVEGLREAIPDHRGDWYFTGDYPTPGGNRVANQAFLNFYEKRDARAYA